jgi:hypothetical protein
MLPQSSLSPLISGAFVMLAVQNQYSNYNLVSLKRLIGLADGEL